ncbi:MAG: MBL fold metallo-hydrolase [Candidatus Hydrogenedentes bacterium]|nr:MBL fold metallo-hydrolase [Candidatus Hydrogenedentota bacterium]
MIVKHFLLNVNEVNSFIAACPTTRDAMLIDAGDFDERVCAFLAENGLTLSKVFITHDHFDHTDGLSEYVKRFRAEVISGTSPVGGCGARIVKHGGEVRLGSLTGRVYSTPGHTPVGLSLAFPGHVFTGDALFAGSVGGTGSKENYDLQLDSIRKHIFTLPDDTLVHVGHGPSSTVAVEKKYNPFFV